MSAGNSAPSQGKQVVIASLISLPRQIGHLLTLLSLIWLTLVPYLTFLISIPLHARQFLPHLSLFQAWQRLWHKYLAYSIEDRIISPATILFFTRSKSMNKHIWLKVWQRRRYGNQNTEDGQRDLDNLLDGWKFNRRFAPGVYLGIASIKGLNEGAQSIERGRLIFMPTKRRLKADEEYVLVMRHLPENERLDKQLAGGSFSSPEDMKFLAREVAHMHKRLKKSPGDMGTYKHISSKLDLNKDLFKRALDRLSLIHEDIEKYKSIIDLLDRACNEYEPLFKERHEGGHIKRCHGDLKSTNLWVSPKTHLIWRSKKALRQLVPLDCIDFRPDFCHIDTLSDVAMLAVDIKVYCTHGPGSGNQDINLSQIFLHAYLCEVQVDSELSQKLLAYYVLEKAIVCAYVSILFDNLLDLGRAYLGVALECADELIKRLNTAEDVPIPGNEAEMALSSHSS